MRESSSLLGRLGFVGEVPGGEEEAKRRVALGEGEDV